MEKKPEQFKKTREKFVVGYDLNDAFVQIGYASLEEGEPETLSLVAGVEQYHIPAVLLRRQETGQWIFGKEAKKAEQDGEKGLVKNLLSLAREGQRLVVGEEEFDPTALLTLFVKRSLSLLTAAGTIERMEGIMFTVDELDRVTVDVLSRMAANLQLKTKNVYFQSHVESFYHFMLNQPKELWNSGVLLFDYDNRRMKVYDFYCNHRTTPVVVLIDVDLYREMERKPEEADSANLVMRQRLDREFMKIAGIHLRGRNVSCVYLIGDGFKDEWMSESLSFLIKGRRGFRGNNLFVKGACYGIRERLGTGIIGGDYAFLGLDKLKANVGMRVLRKGQESYFALMDAGINWFDAKNQVDVILESGETISVVITPVDGKEPREIHMILEGIPERPQRTTRLHIEVNMESENQLGICVTDKGFGELFPSSDAKWTKLFDL